MAVDEPETPRYLHLSTNDRSYRSTRSRSVFSAEGFTVATSMYLEEFAPGQRFTSEEFTLTADDLTAFGAVSGDEHPMHTPGAAPDSEVIGHGPLGIAKYFGT